MLNLLNTVVADQKAGIGQCALFSPSRDSAEDIDAEARVDYEDGRDCGYWGREHS